MDRNQKRLEAGLIYLMAIALQRRSKVHEALSECARWLREQGYEREAEQLNPGCNDVPVLARATQRAGVHYTQHQRTPATK